jgi:hypothetical protein
MIKPILFSTPMVQAILEGRKTMTRRTVKLPKNWIPEDDLWDWVALQDFHPEIFKYKVGDVLWVRETFYSGYVLDENDNVPDNAPLEYWYFADTRDSRPGDMSDEKCMFLFGNDKKIWPSWKPSIFMPKAACRIFLEITDVKVERLQDISEEDAINEGVELLPNNRYKYYLSEYFDCINAVHSFQTLWKSINGAESWEANPFVWAIEFKQITKPENFY